MPEEFRAELIGGEVCIAMPVSVEHSNPDGLMSGWLFNYRARTPGLTHNPNSTVILGQRSEPQPDLLLRVLPSHGGRVRIVEKYLSGAPELIVKIAVSTRQRDLQAKRADYWNAGVDEYLVVLPASREVLWHVRGPHDCQLLEPDADGLFKSPLFGGLWLDPAALWAEDASALLAALERGLATPDPAATVARLAAARS